MDHRNKKDSKLREQKRKTFFGFLFCFLFFFLPADISCQKTIRIFERNKKKNVIQ